MKLKQIFEIEKKLRRKKSLNKKKFETEKKIWKWKENDLKIKKIFESEKQFEGKNKLELKFYFELKKVSKWRKGLKLKNIRKWKKIETKKICKTTFLDSGFFPVKKSYSFVSNIQFQFHFFPLLIKLDPHLTP